MTLAPCPDCRTPVDQAPGPTHPYLGASAGCWKLYGEVLAKEYEDARCREVHRLTVDAYAAQHPGKPERRAVQSVNVHLAALYLVLERGVSLDEATRAIGRLTKREDFRWLEPPASFGDVTIADVRAARTPQEHQASVRRWAESVWRAWALHHSAVRALCQPAPPPISRA